MTRHCIVRGFCWFVCACALVSILALSAAEKDGFVSIFNGSNLDGWKTSPQIEKHWVAKNGNLKNSTALPREDSATLWTEKSYNRYTLIFDWRSVAKEHAQESIAVLVYGGPPHRILLKGNSEGGWNHAEIKVQDGIVFASVYQSPP